MIIENPENFNNNEYESKYMDIESNYIKIKNINSSKQ